MTRLAILALAVLLAAIAAAPRTCSGASNVNIGVNWGTMMSHPLLPTTVVEMLKANGIQKVKLFDADSWTMGALAGSGIEVMVAIPNDQLEKMSKDYGNAKAWVKENVTSYDHAGGVHIKYVAVGNEPFLTSYNGSFLYNTFPALKNIQRALNEAGVGDRIKATVPLNADVYDSPANNPVPSAGNFRSDIHDLMLDIVRFLHSNNAPFVVNIYPFLSLYQNPDFPVDFAFFGGGGKSINDKGTQYTNVFDANFDTLLWALKKAGVPDLKVTVGEAGWPTDGDKSANIANAKKFYDGFLKKLAKKEGTPMRPGPMEVYLFGLIDENVKSVLPGSFERHWGLFRYDGQPKFPMDLTGAGHDVYLVAAKGVQYFPDQWCVLSAEAPDSLKKLSVNMDFACSNSDCTTLAPGSSCSHLDQHVSASYAFNMYFQMQDQDVRACDFEGLAKITKNNASTNGCYFPVQIASDARRVAAMSSKVMLVVMVSLLNYICTKSGRI